MAISFNHATRRIHVPQVDAAPLLLQTLVNAIREEEASDRGIANDLIADASGKDDLGTGTTTGITVALMGGWLIEFQAGAYQARIDGGNLAGGLSKIANTGSPQVLLQSSVATTLADSGGGGGTGGPSLSDIADVIRTELAKLPVASPSPAPAPTPGTLSNVPKVILPSSEPAPIVRPATIATGDGRNVVSSSQESPPVAVIQGSDPPDSRKVIVQ